MLFGKKEDKKELPDLPQSNFALGKRAGRVPPLNDLSPLDNFEDLRERSLPSFPDSPTHNKFSQVAIKDAVGGTEEEEELPEFMEDESEESYKNTTEMEEWEPSDLQPEVGFPVPREDSVKPIMLQQEEPRKIGLTKRVSVVSQESFNRPHISDVFVKIDKFHSARKSLSDIAQKLEEIDNLIKRIRETKLREEQELSMWEKDVSHIKARVQEVTQNIFEKVE